MGKFLILVVLFGVVTYAVVWTIMRRQAAGRGGAVHGPVRGRRTPPKQVAPDDDEDFLRWLERKQRSTKPEAPQPPAGPAGGPVPGPEPGTSPEADQDPEKDPDSD